MSKYDPQQLQQKFEQWRKLRLEQLEAQKNWLEAEALYSELKEYYLSPQWMTDREQDLELQYSGDAHSLLSEDALWDMLSERDELAKRWMRLGLDALDKQ